MSNLWNNFFNTAAPPGTSVHTSKNDITTSGIDENNSLHHLG
jgi:hypothetical protein